MESITIGQIAEWLAIAAALVGGYELLKAKLEKWVGTALKDDLQEIKGDIKSINETVGETDMNACKNFLVARLSEIERGDQWDEIEKERFWEQYQHYTKKGGNSYIAQRVEEYKKEGRI